jgi:hypothetical protein
MRIGCELEDPTASENNGKPSCHPRELAQGLRVGVDRSRFSFLLLPNVAFSRKHNLPARIGIVALLDSKRKGRNASVTVATTLVMWHIDPHPRIPFNIALLISPLNGRIIAQYIEKAKRKPAEVQNIRVSVERTFPWAVSSIK